MTKDKLEISELPEFDIGAPISALARQGAELAERVDSNDREARASEDRAREAMASLVIQAHDLLPRLVRENIRDIGDPLHPEMRLAIRDFSCGADGKEIIVQRSVQRGKGFVFVGFVLFIGLALLIGAHFAKDLWGLGLLPRQVLVLGCCLTLVLLLRFWVRRDARDQSLPLQEWSKLPFSELERLAKLLVVIPRKIADASEGRLREAKALEANILSAAGLRRAEEEKKEQERAQAHWDAPLDWLHPRYRFAADPILGDPRPSACERPWHKEGDDYWGSARGPYKPPAGERPWYKEGDDYWGRARGPYKPPAREHSVQSVMCPYLQRLPSANGEADSSCPLGEKETQAYWDDGPDPLAARGYFRPASYDPIGARYDDGSSCFRPGLGRESP